MHINNFDENKLNFKIGNQDKYGNTYIDISYDNTKLKFSIDKELETSGLCNVLDKNENKIGKYLMIFKLFDDPKNLSNNEKDIRLFFDKLHSKILKFVLDNKRKFNFDSPNSVDFDKIIQRYLRRIYKPNFIDIRDQLCEPQMYFSARLEDSLLKNSSFDDNIEKFIFKPGIAKCNFVLNQIIVCCYDIVTELTIENMNLKYFADEKGVDELMNEFDIILYDSDSDILRLAFYGIYESHI